MKWYKEKEILEELIKSGKSYEEIGKMYNCSGSNIKKSAKRIGISLQPRRKINPIETFNRGTAKTSKCINCEKEFILYKSNSGKFCSYKCQQDYRHK